MPQIRIATVKATGRRYIVQQIDFSRTPTVHCWGEVTAVSSGRRQVQGHDDSLSFPREAVEVAAVKDTAELRNSLTRQGVDFLQAQGHFVSQTRCGNWRIDGLRRLGTADQLMKQAERAERLGFQDLAEQFLRRAADSE